MQNEPDTAAHTRLVPIPEAAEALGVSVSTVWRLIRDGELRTVSVRSRTLISASEILAFIAEHGSA